MFFFFNDTATTEIYTLSLHDALPIFAVALVAAPHRLLQPDRVGDRRGGVAGAHDVVLRLGDREERREPTVLADRGELIARSEEHTSELQSRQYLVCRLLLEKKKNSKE